MAKDYEYYRAGFIEEMYDMTSTVTNLSKTLTPIEGIALFHLTYLQNYYGHGFLQITTQLKIDQYTVDFLAEYTNKQVNRKIIIECDGHEFHEKTKEQAAKDKKRDRHLSAKGFILLRFSGSEIVNNPFLIGESIVAIITKAK